jgi:asparagine synthase (glutamine-hydrolysing)
MSVQFGKCTFDSKHVKPEDLDRTRRALASYGPEGESCTYGDNIAVFYRAFQTTKESRDEKQPHITASGCVLVWDGRLDNREVLIRELGDTLTVEQSDVCIVAAAYERWGSDCLAKLVGDWALSLWRPGDRSLILAKDAMGVRQLYYSFDDNQATWSTVLDPLVLFADRCFELDEEYVAGWLVDFPAPHLTPYAGIHSVPPSCIVCLERGKRTIAKYWDFDPGRRICYGCDAEYEDHFRVVFEESVRRRLRADAPVLAELSGGMDSSSIVCMADSIIARGGADTSILETISYYNDSEPNWDERPFFTRVETKRGRTGCHIDLNTHGAFLPLCDVDGFAATPAAARYSSETNQHFLSQMRAIGSRVLLSGIGGDEVLGGNPSPIPELTDLLISGSLTHLPRKLLVWALATRKPVFHLLLSSLRWFWARDSLLTAANRQRLPWIALSLKPPRRNPWDTSRRFGLFWPRPSFQDSLRTLDVLRAQVAGICVCPELPYETRFPYLDRDLLEFLYAIPREQLVRPNQRRSLMRRALVGIVPDEILQRRRKAYAIRDPMRALAKHWTIPTERVREMPSVLLGIVDPAELLEELKHVHQGQAAPIVPLLRTFALDSWLSAILERKLIRNRGAASKRGPHGSSGRARTLAVG